MYRYAANNPVRYTDPDGRDIIIRDIAQSIKNLTSAQKLTRDAKIYQHGAGGNFNLPEPYKTWCNQSTFDIMEATGFNTKAIYGSKSRWDINANSATINFAKAAEISSETGIFEVSPDFAQFLADFGVTVVVAWNSGESGSGHLSTVVPQSTSDIKYSSDSGPVISNVGLEIGIKSTKDGFGNANKKEGGWKKQVKFYIDINQTMIYSSKNIAKDMTRGKD